MVDPTKSATDAGEGDSRQRIDAEHRHLNEVLAELVAAREPERIERLLVALRSLLIGHFATEEAPDGLHEIVAQNAAHRLPNVQQLFAEHRDLVHRLDALRVEAAALREGAFRRLLDEVAGLAAALRAHEAVEDEIFAEAFYTDIGGRA
jgi:hemerythrin